MMEDLSLQSVIDALSSHPRRTFTFYTKNGTRQSTFAQLLAQLEAEAPLAAALGLGHGSVVGVVAKNSYEAALLDLLLLKLGCTTIQAPESDPRSSFGSLIESLEFLILAPGSEPTLVDDSYRRVGTLYGFATYAKQARVEPRNERFRGLPAVVFSSGTSGKIKRLMVSARGITHNAQLFFSALQLTPDDSFLIFLPLSNFQQKLLIYGCILANVNIYLTDSEHALGALSALKPTLFLAPPIFYESAWKLAQAGLAVMGGSAPASAEEGLRTLFGGRIRMMWSGMAPIPPDVLVRYRDAEIPLYEAYGMTEFGPITVNLSTRNRLGTVGRPLAAASVRLAPDGEVIACSDFPLTVGYLGESEADEKAVYLDARSVATGDIGYFDEEGYLCLRGRKKELILTSSGHKIHPQLVENQFAALPFVAHAVLMGNERPHLGILIMVHEVTSAAMSAVSEKIDELNLGPCKSFPIKKWSLQAGALSVENGMLTRNLKLNRSRVAERYESIVFSSAPATAH